jgi:hypothetical protein
MKCDRCEGLMIEDDFLDMEESFEGMWLRAWRCLNCGRALDPVILANQQRQGDLKPKLRQDEVFRKCFSILVHRWLRSHCLFRFARC